MVWTCTLPVTVTPNSWQTVPSGTTRLPLTIPPGGGFGGQVVSARAACSAINMIPNVSSAVAKRFIVPPVCRRAPEEPACADGRPNLDILSRPSRNQTGISNALHPRPYGLFLDDLPIHIRPDLPAARVQT